MGLSGPPKNHTPAPSPSGFEIRPFIPRPSFASSFGLLATALFCAGYRVNAVTDRQLWDETCRTTNSRMSARSDVISASSGPQRPQHEQLMMMMMMSCCPWSNSSGPAVSAPARDNPRRRLSLAAWRTSSSAAQTRTALRDGRQISSTSPLKRSATRLAIHSSTDVRIRARPSDTLTVEATDAHAAVTGQEAPRGAHARHPPVLYTAPRCCGTPWPTPQDRSRIGLYSRAMPDILAPARELMCYCSSGCFRPTGHRPTVNHVELQLVELMPRGDLWRTEVQSPRDQGAKGVWGLRSPRSCRNLFVNECPKSWCSGRMK